MPPNGTKSSLPVPISGTSTHLKTSMDTVHSPPTDLTPASSTTSSACSLPVLGSTPPQPQRPASKNCQTLDMKREADRLKTYERWPASFMDPHRLSAAEFYSTNKSDVVRCAFCKVEVGRWEEGDDPFKDHRRWSPYCEFIRGLPVGNIPISSDSQPETVTAMEANRSFDVCGPYMEVRPNSGPERGMLCCLHLMLSFVMWESGNDSENCVVAAVSNGVHHNTLTPEELQKHGINQSRGPLHPSYNTYDARVRSYDCWPRSLKQKPDKLSEAGFYYTGK